MWGFQEIRDGAIKSLSEMSIDAVEQVLLGRDYNIPEWIIKGYLELIEREMKLSWTEASALGFETAWLLTGIRESTFSNGVEKSSRRWQGRQLDTVEADICRTFSNQLKDAGYVGNDAVRVKKKVKTSLGLV